MLTKNEKFKKKATQRKENDERQIQHLRLLILPSESKPCKVLSE